MRKLIGQILEVVATAEESQPLNLTQVVIARKSAIIKVAFARGIDQATISDKYIRQLGLDGTEDFDELLANWLLSGSQDLRNVLLERAESEDETVAIRQVFQLRTRKATIEKKDDKWLVQITLDLPLIGHSEIRVDAYSDALSWLVKNTK